jgi:glutamate-1-semialdehyde 2,1-aminomutase
MSAIRLARGYTQRDLILKFDGCYHGHVDSLLVRAGSGLAEMASPDSAGITAKNASETLVVALDDDSALEAVFAAHGAGIAAAIIEPLPANNGLLLQRTEFLKKLETLCRKHGALLIFDEVISGFRVGVQGMAGVTGITPDLVTYGKIIGGGMPVGAYGGKKQIMDHIAPMGPVYQAGTLSANPVAMQAGHAMLKKILRENPHPKLAAMGEKFIGELQSLADRHLPFPAHYQTHGSISWMVCQSRETVRRIEQIPSEQKSLYSKIFHGFLEEGVYFAPSGYEVGFLSTAHTNADLGCVLEAAEKVFKSIQA